MKNYIYYIIAAVATWYLFFRKKTTQATPPANGINPVKPPINQQPPTYESPGVPSGCPDYIRTAQACAEWKKKQAEIAASQNQPVPSFAEEEIIPVKPVQKPPMHDVKPPTFIIEPEKPQESAPPSFNITNPISKNEMEERPGYTQPGTPAMPAFGVPPAPISTNDLKIQADTERRIRLKAEALARAEIQTQKDDEARAHINAQNPNYKPVALLQAKKAAAWSMV